MRALNIVNEPNAAIGKEAPRANGAVYSAAVISAWNLNEGNMQACVINYFVTNGMADYYTRSIEHTPLGKELKPVAILKIKTRKICLSN